jgi:hypothetical protein
MQFKAFNLIWTFIFCAQRCILQHKWFSKYFPGSCQLFELFTHYINYSNFSYFLYSTKKGNITTHRTEMSVFSVSSQELLKQTADF